MLGTLFGVAAFVAVLGLTSTASGQISKRLTALSSTEVTVEDSATDRRDTSAAFPTDAERRLAMLHGVRSSGVYWRVSRAEGQRPILISARPPRWTGGADGEPLDVYAASPGYFDAIHARVGEGRTFDAFHDGQAQQVALLGRAAATRLGVHRIDGRTAVFIDGRAFTVLGIIDDVQRTPGTLLSAVIPARTAERFWGIPGPGSDQPTRMIIDTRLGAARLVGEQVPLALRPQDPGRLKVNVPPDPRALRESVGTDLSTLFLLLAGVCLVVGAVGIANTTLVAVLERIPEIGLRRALGARRRHIAGQFLCESAALGLIGGLLGTAFGVLAVVVIALTQKWTPILEPLTVLPSPLIGGATGLLAGFYPAFRAARIEPVEALRR